MINKEHYQIIRRHPAFAHFPVEIFDKIAIEIQFRKIPKGQIIFFSGDRRDRLSSCIEAMFVSNSMIQLILFLIWIILK